MKRMPLLIVVAFLSLAPGCNRPSSLPLRDANVSHLKLDQFPSSTPTGTPFAKSLPLQSLASQGKN